MTAQHTGRTNGFIRFSGGALLLGGATAALLNLVLTPMLPTGSETAVVATSAAFGIRMPLAAVSVALVTIGCVGLYLAQAERLRFGAVAFLVAGLGGMMAFCAECVQFTLVRDLAFGAPETLTRLEEAGALSRYDIGFAIGAGTFLVGWLAVAIITWRVGVLSRRGPLTLLLGMILVAILGALAGVWGAVVGNVVLGSGWVFLGQDLRRLSAS